jgi:hypothetical protein
MASCFLVRPGFSPKRENRRAYARVRSLRLRKASTISTPEDSRPCSKLSAARLLAAMKPAAVSIISRPTESVCAIPNSTPEACVLPPAWSRPDAGLPLVRISHAGPFQAPMPSSHYAAQDLVVTFKTSGSEDQNAGLHDSSLSWRAPRAEKARAHS